MNHPLIASANGNERYNRMLKDAESFRKSKALTMSMPRIQIFANLRQTLTNLFPQDTGQTADTPA